MPLRVPSRKRRLILLPFFVIGGILLGYVFILADKRLDSVEMATLIVCMFAVCCLLELIAVWWEGRSKGDALKDSFHEMIGKKGIVAKDCSPEGTVRIGLETWHAISINSAFLKSGDPIIVKERQGLKLYVEKTS